MSSFIPFHKFGLWCCFPIFPGLKPNWEPWLGRITNPVFHTRHLNSEQNSSTTKCPWKTWKLESKSTFVYITSSSICQKSDWCHHHGGRHRCVAHLYLWLQGRIRPLLGGTVSEKIDISTSTPEPFFALRALPSKSKMLALHHKVASVWFISC